MTARAIRPADILLPKVESMEKWSVIACDQFAEDAEYWNRVEGFVGSAPSTLRMILPEAGLQGDVRGNIERINSEMEKYSNEGVFGEYAGAMFYIERGQSNGRVRKGILCMIDLMEYDYAPCGGALIRASERTVSERIPARVAIRENALLELPHVMVFMDDGRHRVIEELSGEKADMTRLYGFELMEGGGRIDGWEIGKARQEKLLSDIGELENSTPMLYAVGDGNHSLAAAKAYYDSLRGKMTGAEWKNIPARYALAEIVSLHDDAIPFKPIHRIVSGVDAKDLLSRLAPLCGKGGKEIGWVADGESGSFAFADASELPARLLQDFIDSYLAEKGGKIDYIHGGERTRRMASGGNVMGFILPDIDKSSLFPMVMKNGPLPRKTFSVGRATDKRYYLESRRIK